MAKQPKPTPIELVAAALGKGLVGTGPDGLPDNSNSVGDVLVPEQCLRVWLNDAWYHVVVTRTPEEELR